MPEENRNVFVKEQVSWISEMRHRHPDVHDRGPADADVVVHLLVVEAQVVGSEDKN